MAVGASFLNINPSTTTQVAFLGSPMIMDPHLTQQHAGLQHAVLRP